MGAISASQAYSRALPKQAWPEATSTRAVEAVATYLPIGVGTTVAWISIWRWGSSQGLLAPPSARPR